MYDVLVGKVYRIISHLFSKEEYRITYTIVTIILLHIFFYLGGVITIIGKLISPYTGDSFVFLVSAALLIPVYWWHFNRYPNSKTIEKRSSKSIELNISYFWLSLMLIIVLGGCVWLLAFYI